MSRKHKEMQNGGKLTQWKKVAVVRQKYMRNKSTRLLHHLSPLCRITKQRQLISSVRKTGESWEPPIILYTSLICIWKYNIGVLDTAWTDRQKARDRYAKLTDEQKAQRNTKRREAYAMKKNGSRASEVHADQSDIFATPSFPVVSSDKTTSGNIKEAADTPVLKSTYYLY